MSISLKLVPFALVMRAVMGKEKFQKWIESNEIRFQTHIIDEDVLEDHIIASGYDFIDYGSFKKTHYNQSYMFWEKNEKGWDAIFSKYEKKEAIEHFFSHIETINNKHLFSRNSISVESNTDLYPTDFVSKELLIEVLKDNCVSFELANEELIKCQINGQKFSFLKKDNNIFYLSVNKNVDRSWIYSQMQELDTDYKCLIQSEAYKRIIEKIRNDDSYQIESEEVLEDDSIVITISEI